MYLPLELLRSLALASSLLTGTPAPAPVAAETAPAVVAPQPRLALAEPAAAPQAKAPETKKAEAKKEGTAADAKALVDKVQAFYEHTKDFTADFDQTYVSKSFGRTMKSSGTVAFKKPAMMRWDYDEPREKSFIVDGKDLWIWTPEDQEAVRSKGFTTDNLSASITFLWGKGRLSDEFDIEKRGEDELVLTPKRPQSGYARLVFKVDPKTGRVLQTTVIDAQGNENTIAFHDLRLNTGLSDAKFHFTPPKGAEVKELTGSGLH